MTKPDLLLTLHSFTIEFGLLFLSLNVIFGLLWGYCFYYERRSLSFAIIGAELLLVTTSLLWLL